MNERLKSRALKEEAARKEMEEDGRRQAKQKKERDADRFRVKFEKEKAAQRKAEEDDKKAWEIKKKKAAEMEVLPGSTPNPTP